MKSKQEGRIDRVRYEKPGVVDLGPTAPIVGASCVTGELVDEADCDTVGNAAAEVCDLGNAAAGCLDGSSPSGFCRDGAGGPSD